jgi:hypothetical protein
MFFSNRKQRRDQAKKYFSARNILPPIQDNRRGTWDLLRFLARQLLLSCQHALDAIDPLLLIDGELLVTRDNSAVERIKPSQFFLVLTHRANDELVSAARQYLEGCGPETADIVEQANHTHHAIFRQLGGA